MGCVLAYKKCMSGILVCESCMVCSSCLMTKTSALRGLFLSNLLFFVAFVHGLLWWSLKWKAIKARFKRNEKGATVRGSAKLLQNGFLVARGIRQGFRRGVPPPFLLASSPF